MLFCGGGTQLRAGQDASVAFYSVERNEAGNITDVSFNFVAARGFEEGHTVCG